MNALLDLEDSEVTTTRFPLVSIRDDRDETSSDHQSSEGVLLHWREWVNSKQPSQNWTSVGETSMCKPRLDNRGMDSTLRLSRQLLAFSYCLIMHIINPTSPLPISCFPSLSLFRGSTIVWWVCVSLFASGNCECEWYIIRENCMPTHNGTAIAISPMNSIILSISNNGYAISSLSLRVCIFISG